MSVRAMQSALDKILTSGNPNVLSIRGPWGIGKTYAWKAYLEGKLRSKEVRFARYAYVSLFGVDSLDQCKFSIFQQSISTDNENLDVTPKTFRDNAKYLFNKIVKKSSGGMLSLPYLNNFEFAAKSLAFLTVRDCLICFDDIERRGKHLIMRDFLGLVSVLSEDRNCTVVLLHNDNALDKDDANEFAKLREKVIDIEIEFHQTPDACSEIAFSPSSALRDRLKEKCVQLGIQNIRVLKKIHHFADLIEESLDGLEAAVLNHALHTLCLLAWCFYTPNDESPDYDYAKRSRLNIPGLDDDEQLNVEEQRWSAILQDYGFTQVDDLDLVIADMIENGYVDENRLSAVANKRNEQVLRELGEQSYSDIWDMYHNTFADNQEEFIATLYKGFKTWVDFISTTNLHGTVRLFRGVGRNDLASDVIDYYIEQRQSEGELFNLENQPFSVDITDSELIKKFQDIHLSNSTTRTLRQVVHAIAGKNGWSPIDEQILADHSVDDYYTLFKAEAGEHLSSCVNACLQFGRLGNATERQQEIGRRSVEALIRISKESPLNALRVKKFGITA